MTDRAPTMNDLHGMAEAMGVSMQEKDFGKGFVDPDKLMAEGWVYRDLPWLDRRLWDGFLEVFGEENFHILAMTARGDMRRGQIMLSERGRLNLVENKWRIEQISADVFGTGGTA